MRSGLLRPPLSQVLRKSPPLPPVSDVIDAEIVDGTTSDTRPTNTSDDAQEPVVAALSQIPRRQRPATLKRRSCRCGAASASNQGEKWGEVDMSDFEEQLEDR